MSTKRILVSILVLALFPSCLPSGDFIDAALLSAESAWGYDVGAQILMWDFGGCGDGSSIASTRLYGTTTIYLNKDCRWTAEPEPLEVLTKCLTHEVGHLLGLDHSDDPLDIMYFSEHGQMYHDITAHERYVADFVYRFGWGGGTLFDPDAPKQKFAPLRRRSSSIQDGEWK